jgi:hypothetical protein
MKGQSYSSTLLKGPTHHFELVERSILVVDVQLVIAFGITPVPEGSATGTPRHVRPMHPANWRGILP